MRILVAPDKFKGTLTADEAARAIAAGWLSKRPGDEVVRLPMADGGEGTLDALVAALGGERFPVKVTGPLGDPVMAEFGIVQSSAGRGAVVELARASGLELVPSARRDAMRASTRGTGETIKAALEHDVAHVIVCIGGSATTDGGAGIAQALGGRLTDVAGTEIGPGGQALLDLSRIDLTSVDPRASSIRFVVACDVDNPLTGPSGAAAIYGPQKGASPEQVVVLDRALAHLAAVITRDLGLDVKDTPGAGAAGGSGAGLIAFFGARLRRGIDVVMDAVGFDARLSEADLVITGEGSFDEQSLHGKTAMGVVDAARRREVDVAILCGRADREAVPDDLAVSSLVEAFGEERAMADTRLALEELAALLAGNLQVRG